MLFSLLIYSFGTGVVEFTHHLCVNQYNGHGSGNVTLEILKIMNFSHTQFLYTCLLGEHAKQVLSEFALRLLRGTLRKSTDAPVHCLPASLIASRTAAAEIARLEAEYKLNAPEVTLLAFPKLLSTVSAIRHFRALEAPRMQTRACLYTSVYFWREAEKQKLVNKI